MSILPAQDLFAHTFDPRVIAGKALHLKQCAYRCRMPGSSVKDKLSGAVPADEMIEGLIVAQFLGDNFNQACLSSASKLLPVAKSAMYKYMGDASGRWDQLAMVISSQAAIEIKPLSKHKDRCLVVDDSVLEHCGAKHMELCTRTWDHNGNSTVKGYNCLQMGWTDGISFLPLGAKLLASDESQAKKPACPLQKHKDFDHRLHGAHIRKEARISKPDLVKAWLKLALRYGLDASYVLMDSWFNYEPLMKSIKAMGMDVIGMLKLDNRSYFRKERLGRYGAYLTLKNLYKSFRHKRRGKDEILGSEVVKAVNQDESIDEGIELRLVYLRHRNDPDEILVLASTDVNLTPERIVQLYARRWMIETNFFNQKQFLGLGYETRSTDYGAQHACANLACIRATIIEFHRRIYKDPRAAGEVFRGAAETLREIPVKEAINELIRRFEEELPKRLEKAGCIAKGKMKNVKRIIKLMITSWYQDMTKYVQDFLSQFPKLRARAKLA